MYHTDKKEKTDYIELQEKLELQYGPAVAQDIVDRLRNSTDVVKIPDYMDVKAMSELQEKFRAQAMLAVWRLKDWRRSRKPTFFQKNLVQLEGVFLERQCQDAINLYRQATKTYFAMYREAMSFLSNGARTSMSFAEQQRA